MIYRWHFLFLDNLSSDFKIAEPLICGQKAVGGVKSAIKIIACHSLSPSFSSLKIIISPSLTILSILIHVDGQLVPPWPNPIKTRQFRWQRILLATAAKVVDPTLSSTLCQLFVGCLCAPPHTQTPHAPPSHGRLPSPWDRAIYHAPILTFLCSQ